MTALVSVGVSLQAVQQLVTRPLQAAVNSAAVAELVRSVVNPSVSFQAFAPSTRLLLILAAGISSILYHRLLSTAVQLVKGTWAYYNVRAYKARFGYATAGPFLQQTCQLRKLPDVVFGNHLGAFYHQTSALHPSRRQPLISASIFEGEILDNDVHLDHPDGFRDYFGGFHRASDGVDLHAWVD